MTAPLGVASTARAAHRHADATAGVPSRPEARQCSRPYHDSAGRILRCGGPMAPIRRPGTLSCGWCGKIELTATTAAA